MATYTIHRKYSYSHHRTLRLHTCAAADAERLSIINRVCNIPLKSRSLNTYFLLRAFLLLSISCSAGTSKRNTFGSQHHTQWTNDACRVRQCKWCGWHFGCSVFFYVANILMRTLRYTQSVSNSRRRRNARVVNTHSAVVFRAHLTTTT